MSNILFKALAFSAVCSEPRVGSFFRSLLNFPRVYPGPWRFTGSPLDPSGVLLICSQPLTVPTKRSLLLEFLAAHSVRSVLQLPV